MRRAAVYAVALVCGAATSACAQMGSLVAEAEQTACTISAEEARPFAAELEALIADDHAVLMGDSYVLSEEICEIGVPDLSDFPSIADPALSDLIRPVMGANGTPRCQMGDWLPAMTTRYGGPDAATRAYMGLLGRGFLEGTLSFYSPDILETPAFVEVLTGGPCRTLDDVPEASGDPETLANGFGAYVRSVGAETPCGDATTASMLLQEAFAPDSENAWIWFQFDIVARAAGLVDGITATDRGVPRPPLCTM